MIQKNNLWNVLLLRLTAPPAPPQLSFGLLLGVGNVGQVVKERPAVDAGAAAIAQLLLHPPQHLLHVLPRQVGRQLASQSHGFSLAEEESIDRWMDRHFIDLKVTRGEEKGRRSVAKSHTNHQEAGPPTSSSPAGSW